MELAGPIILHRLLSKATLPDRETSAAGLSCLCPRGRDGHVRSTSNVPKQWVHEDGMVVLLVMMVRSGVRFLSRVLLVVSRVCFLIYRSLISDGVGYAR